MINKDLLIKPLITEKSMQATEKGEYTFLFKEKANKNQIKEIIRELFGVNVVSVKTIKVKGKKRRTGRKRLLSETSSYKKAIIKVKKGEKISLFEAGK